MTSVSASQTLGSSSAPVPAQASISSKIGTLAGGSVVPLFQSTGHLNFVPRAMAFGKVMLQEK